jgi:uncharacterized protein YggU (UPF0235/DUF167 family)
MVKLGSAKQSIENFGNNRYLVYLISKDNNLANQELIEFISKNLGAPVSHITLIKGESNNNKVLEFK